jgi:hypothetical protein
MAWESSKFDLEVTKMKVYRMSSMGTHSFSFFQGINKEEYDYLYGDFIRFQKHTGKVRSYPIQDAKKPEKTIGIEYAYTNSKGIRFKLYSFEAGKNYFARGVMVIITPQVLLSHDYIRVLEETDLDKVEELYNMEAERISPILMQFGQCSLSRGDPALTIDLRELGYRCSPQQMMALIKRGDIPAGFTERKEYKKKSHRKKKDKYAFYLANGSVVCNFYWKYTKIDKKHPLYRRRDEFYYIIRLEVQCKRPKLYALFKDTKHLSKYFRSGDDMTTEELCQLIQEGWQNPTVPIDMALADATSTRIIQQYLSKVIHDGDYFTLEGAQWMVKAHHFNENKETRLITALEDTSSYKGIANTKSKLSGKDLKEYKRSLKDLDSILVNPVTIPRGWDIEHIPHPLRAFRFCTAEEHLLPENELLLIDLFKEYSAIKRRR